MAQDKPAKSIPIVFEKVYLHTDREQYHAGEDLWFKAYLVNARNDTLINSSNNLYVELIGHGGLIRDRRLIRMDIGLGHGDFKLSDSLVTGTYRLRAYTNWMRNFGDNFVFEKEIKIYSNKKEQQNHARSLQPGTVASTSPRRSPVENIVNADSIRFFPEGGSLIENIQSTIAFKAINTYDKGIGLKGIIETQSGEKVADISTQNGVGSFTLKPLAGVSYRAKGQYADGKSFNAQLPQALLKGFAMHVTGNDSLFNITIGTDTATLNQLQNKPVLLTCKSKGKTYKSFNILLKRTDTILQIPKNIFPAGIAYFTLYDANDWPNCERLVYIKDSTGPLLNIAPDKKAYGAKEKTAVTIKAPPKSKLSMAVTQAGLVNPNQLNIVSYLHLQSEVRGKIENPDQYFNKANPERKKQLDLLLLTQGWRDFIWRRLADSALRISYIQEKGITVTGKLTRVFSKKPIPDMNISLFIDSAMENKLFMAHSDSAGAFFIDGVNVYGNQPFTANAINDKGKGKGLITVDTAVHSYYPIKKVTYMPDTSTADRKFKDEMERRAKLSKKYAVVNGGTLLQEVTIIRHPLPVERTFADSIVHIKRGDYKYRTLGAYAGMLYGRYKDSFSRYEPPLVIFTSDSLPAMRTNFTDFHSIPMDQIISLHYRVFTMKGLPPSVLQQEQGFIGGIAAEHYIWIDLVVRPSVFYTSTLNVANLEMEGYNKARVFYAPKYESPNNKPDLRTTIQWEPDITTDKNGEAHITYYNADPQNNVNIAIEGITPDGHPLAGVASYEVR